MNEDDQVAHVALRLGRLMLANGAGAERVQEAVAGYVRRFGRDGRVMVSAEGLILTIEGASGFHTRLGQPLGGMGVNMGRLSALQKIRRADWGEGPDFAAINAALDKVESRASAYPPLLVMAGMGLTAASLARLFGAEWDVVYVSALVGIVTQMIRQWLTGRSTNPIVSAALAAFGGGLTGAIVMRAFPGVSPTLCLVAAGMILVPGAPLINGVRDTFGNHVGVGISRLMQGAVTVLAITFGLFLAAGLVGDRIPVGGELTLLPLEEDLLFSALAGVGFALLFNVPLRAAWTCIFCALVGHGFRTWMMSQGFDLAAASMGGAFLATLLARVVGWGFDMPPVAFAFPGVVAMIPGSFGFRTGIGGLEIMKAGAEAPASLVAETAALMVTTVLVTSGIAIGLCIALALPSLLPARKQGHGT